MSRLLIRVLWVLTTGAIVFCPGGFLTCCSEPPATQAASDESSNT